MSSNDQSEVCDNVVRDMEESCDSTLKLDNTHGSDQLENTPVKAAYFPLVKESPAKDSDVESSNEKNSSIDSIVSGQHTEDDTDIDRLGDQLEEET